LLCDRTLAWLVNRSPVDLYDRTPAAPSPRNRAATSLQVARLAVRRFKISSAISSTMATKPRHRKPAEPMTGSFLYVIRGGHNLVKVGVLLW
jgi:hypothetical protein